MNDHNRVENLVSIMVPCYNGERYVRKLLESVLNQTYPNIQMIFVNDGSTDKTEQIVLSYREKFEKRGMVLEYHYKENGGAASAINIALPFVKGEYCMWIDSDDVMQPNHLEKKVNAFLRDKSADIVMCRGVILREYDGTFVCNLGDEKAVGTLFEDILLENRRCSNGLFMVKTDALIESLGGTAIYPSRAGQNMQLLLPVTYNRKVVYIEDRVFDCVYREDSHSRDIRGYKQWIERWDALLDVKNTILKSMSNKFSAEYYEKIREAMILQNVICRAESFWNTDLDDAEIKYIKSVCRKWLGKQFETEKRKIYIWGMGKKGEKTAKLLCDFFGIVISGIIDTNYEKYTEALSPDILNPKEAYVIIPLLYYEAIMTKLGERGYGREDYSYPRAVLRRSLEDGFL